MTRIRKGQSISMSMTMTINAQELQKRYNGLLTLINSIGSEAHARVGAHIRAITNGELNSLAFYHVRASATTEEKYEEYGRIASALGAPVGNPSPTKSDFKKPDWSKLKGQLGNGAKKAEPEVQRVDPMEAPPAPRAVTPEPEPEVDDGEAERLAIERGDETDDLADTLARVLEKRMKVAGKIDEGKVRLIVEEQLSDLHERVAKANNNGSFPADRVQKHK